MGELGALFNPGMRHEIEERQSKASRREEEGQADPGNLRIDLLSGVAVINMGSKATGTDPEGEDVTDPETTEADDTAADDNPADDNPADENGSGAAPEHGDTEEAVQSTDDDSAEVTKAPTADTGTAPRLPAGSSVSADGDIDADALQIARETSNTEPPV
ncbi:DUF6191 domain-containing protein [Nakamurella lactea]|uniref:DUF6191 domain-containing protein n=1 Tax=Nakamurella lactea TaxID=459515 RepID=UPI0003F7E909|nr:DUF6191 domain-containing protein [Nakamurella lactea]